MKKSILALGAAVALGGLGVAGSAHAVAYFGAGNTVGHTTLAASTALSLNPGATGHMLFTPYFTAQGNMGTLFNITNTDLVRGKAVKVRFRGAANSDDVLDFTVFLSPGDVWTGSVAKDAATGRAAISTSDKSCTIPDATAFPGVFKTDRLASYLAADVKNANVNEGYIEVLNMADIPPFLDMVAGEGGTKANPLFTNIKHKAGVAPCDNLAFQTVLSTDIVDAAGAEAAGLFEPTGGLMGSWAVFNQSELAVYSGNQTAVVAHAGWGQDNAQTPLSARGRIIFAPQVGSPVGVVVDGVTADPLLRGAAPLIQPLWFDLPDMSTPLDQAVAGAIDQARNLSTALWRSAVYNDYVATAAGAAVPMSTDWVVSQPTRRYHAAVNYGASASASALVWNADMANNATPTTTTAPTLAQNMYAPLSLNKTLAMGPQACIMLNFSSAGREEQFQVAGGGFSPGVSLPNCGEVFTVSFGATSVLQGAVTNTRVNPVSTEGWARLALGAGRLPMVGFAATSIVNTATNGNYGLTLPHRWVD
ncbi:hypothetical protein H0I39_06430 [Ottowia beijingensis]|uniref:Cell surface protein n=1 Tax=Ottowia beijingensis TaxID=1207057 RepID=A0A853IWA0_9BURK|nr:hypothetical protein [Ottowia beijingensis]NZA01490.1 hypothetical protein [Ottowia beijingensis]